MLEIKNISKSYGRHPALSNLCLRIPDGALYGLVGPNGAGKTTAIKIISGIIYPDRGSIFFDDINLCDYQKKSKETIGYVPDVLGIYDVFCFYIRSDRISCKKEVGNSFGAGRYD